MAAARAGVQVAAARVVAAEREAAGDAPGDAPGAADRIARAARLDRAADLDRLPTLTNVGDTCNGEAGTRDPLNMTDPEALRRLARYLRWHAERGIGEADWPERAALADRRAAMFEAAA